MSRVIPVYPTFWHGDTASEWLIIEPTALKRLMEIEQAIYIWKAVAGVKQS